MIQFTPQRFTALLGSMLAATTLAFFLPLGTLSAQSTDDIEINPEALNQAFNENQQQPGDADVSASFFDARPLVADNPSQYSSFRQYVVNTLDDTTDGHCDHNHCSLREAIEALNDDFSPARISFALNQPRPWSITLTAPLPELTTRVIIDARTGESATSDEPAQFAAETERLILIGERVGDDQSALVLKARASEVLGLSLVGFNGDAIVLAGEGEHQLAANHFQSNAGHAVRVSSSGNQIGAEHWLGGNQFVANHGGGVLLLSGEANQIIANQFDANRQGAILISGAAEQGNRILGNLFVNQGEQSLLRFPELFTQTQQGQSELGLNGVDISLDTLIAFPGVVAVGAELFGQPQTAYIIELIADSQCGLPIAQQSLTPLQQYSIITDRFGYADISVANRIDENTTQGIRFAVQKADGHSPAMSPCFLIQQQCEDQASCEVLSNTRLSSSRRLSVSVSGPGFVISSPLGISCPTDCSHTYFNPVVVVDLFAIPASNSINVSWSSCDILITARQCRELLGASNFVSASFSNPPVLRTLTVTRIGNGRVTSSPSGINCGSDCNQSYNNGTSVRLTASPDSGYRFNGWGGACSGTSTSCTVLMTASRSVTATFTRITHNLTVTRTGNGTVTSSPSGINCGSDCSQSYNAGTFVSLFATPASGYRFVSWSGDCSGTVSTCSVRMDGARQVNARFEQSNQPPVARNDSAQGLEDESITIPVLNNDSDPDGDPLSLIAVSQPAHGRVQIVGSQVTYIPDAKYFGSDQFTYTISDGNGGSASATVSINILPVNDAPVALCQDVTVAADSSCAASITSQQLDAGSFDVDGDSISLSFTPAGPFTLGTHPLTLLVNDGTGGANSEASCQATLNVVDGTAPEIICPLDLIQVSATDTLAVHFPAPTAVDNCSVAPQVSCTPQSGDLFNLGLTTVQCAALDESNNRASCAFQVEVRTPAEQADTIADLIDDLVANGVINSGQANALNSKLEQVVANHNDQASCGALGAFDNQLQALINRGALSEEEAQAIRDATALLEQAYGC